MNRKDWEKQVFESDLNPTARLICLAIGDHGNWEDSKTVWPSRQRISAMTGVSRETVSKYMAALEEQGWLKVVKTLKDNVKEYALCKPQVVESVGILARTGRGRKDGFESQVVESLDKQVVESVDEVVESLDKQVVESVELGCLMTRHEPKRNLPVEPTKEPTTTVPVAGAPLTVPPNRQVKESQVNKRELTEAFLTWKRYVPTDDPLLTFVEQAVFDRTWETDEVRPNHRIDRAVKEFWREQEVVL